MKAAIVYLDLLIFESLILEIYDKDVTFLRKKQTKIKTVLP